MSQEEKHVLIVEDSPTQAIRLQFLLQKEGYRVNLASNGQEGLEKAQTEKPDLIISDVVMPEMDGYELCTALKADPRTQDIPIILLTAQDHAEDIVRGLMVGADNFIPKPYGDTFLLNRVRAFFANPALYGPKKPRMESHLELAGQAVTVTPEKLQIVELMLGTLQDLALAHRRLEEQHQQLQASLEEVRRLNHQLETLRNLAEITIATLALDEALDLSLSRVLVALSLEQGFILLRKPETGTPSPTPRPGPGPLPATNSAHSLTLIGTRGLSSDLAHWVTCPETGEDYLAKAVRTGQTVLVEDLSEDHRLSAALEGQADLGSLACTPLKTGEETMGILGIFSPRGRPFTEYDLELLSACGLQIGLVVNRLLLYQETQRLAITDGLTELVNHRHFYDILETQLAQFERYAIPVSLILLDLDNFKVYNDTHGHPAGDELLREIGALIRSQIRQADTAARYGGEEFAVILPGVDKRGAVIPAERIRQAVANCNSLSPVTISAGVAACPEDGTTTKALVRAADAALYQAKQAGKNRVVAADDA